MKEVAAKYPGKVRFVSEDWGNSELAARYGIKRYPVVFVDEVLVAKPDDFGWGGAKGRYKPWRDPANHEKFRKDLVRMIELARRDRRELVERFEVKADSVEIAALPDFTAQGLDGQEITPSSLAGQVVVVEFWATWCPPCRSTLNWMADLKRRYGSRLTVIAVSVESEEAEVRKLVGSLDPSIKFALGSDALVTSFGDITSVPTMFIFDQQGKAAAVFYGAPADLHKKAGRVFESLLK
ncbi:MAG TPA: TlpA disulfide reductase family protein [Blastocatellia bacterium]|nr:TlpA disulfide reductase family protein [Blastocatellia bacterium]